MMPCGTYLLLLLGGTLNALIVSLVGILLLLLLLLGLELIAGNATYIVFCGAVLRLVRLGLLGGSFGGLLGDALEIIFDIGSISLLLGSRLLSCVVRSRI